ncbi:MAG: DNA helicase [Chloroflexi bacterium HGW-Chloroflexi-9]|nr:MAG: DNA helicase [Chloroflexi bacterium HGW-Chloroflexi-9]
MAKTLSFDYTDGNITVVVSRGQGIPNVVWLKVQSEWGARGRHPARAVDIPVSTFLSRLDWVAPYCRQHGISAEWRGDSRKLVMRRVAEHRLLQEALAGGVETEPEEVEQALRASRFQRELRSFQRRDLLQLVAIANGANFSVPGAGKTSVAYAVYEYERALKRVDRLLVVAPISAFESWEEEAKRCFATVPTIRRFDGRIEPGTEVLLINYQRLQSGFAELATWVASGRTHMILDEAHRMKRGWGGEWGRNCLSLAHFASRRDILTGTPAPQSVFDLVALFDFLWPGEARRLIPSDGQDPTATARVADRIAPLFVRTTKSELDLPEPRVRLIERPLDSLHSDIYAALVGRYRGVFAASRRAEYDLRALGRVVMYLLEAATNPALLTAGSHRHDAIEFRHPPLDIPPDSEVDELLRAYPDYETPWKFRLVKELSETNARLGRKTLIWSNFVRNLETLRHYELEPLHPAIVHGGVADRSEQLRRFREDPDCAVLLANPAALGEGTSLHEVCHDAIYIERTFNAGQYLQSMDRIHRLGLPADQETRVTVLSSRETIDDIVDTRLRQKTDRLATLMQDPGLNVMALPAAPEDGLEGEEGLDVDNLDLAALARHLAGE